MAIDRFLALSNSALKMVSGKNYSKVGIIPITECLFVQLFLSRTLLRRYISSKIEPSFVEDIKMTNAFGGVRQYVEWLIIMYKVTSKIKFDIFLWGGGGFMKNVAVTFSVPKSIYKWPLNKQAKYHLGMKPIFMLPRLLANSRW